MRVCAAQVTVTAENPLESHVPDRREVAPTQPLQVKALQLFGHLVDGYQQEAGGVAD